jgi:prephenate dehydrogenase
VNELAEAQVAIVGLGLMGGSLGGALKGKCGQVVGVARRRESIETALERGLIGRGALDLEDGVAEADVVVLATPVRVILKQLAEIGSLVKAGCLVLDLGSTKREVVERMRQLPRGVQPLGGHPMCGKEVGGIEAAEPALYEGCTFVLTPLERTSAEAVALGRELAEAAGGKPVLLEAERHDRLVARASHLPYVLACALMRVVADAGEEDAAVWEVAASGFRDTSRLAASEVTMTLDILLTNREAVLEAVARCEEELGQLGRLLAAGDEAGLRAALTRAREERMGWAGGRREAGGQE